MKECSKHIRKFFILILLFTGCLAVLTARADVTFQTLCLFKSSNPTAPLSPSGVLTEVETGNFYGTTQSGGTNGNGTVFLVTSTGVLTPIFKFNGFNGGSPNGLTLGADGDLYGTTYQGGNVSLGFQNGTIFKITTNGVLTSLYWFGGTNGYNPIGGLIFGNDSNFYGVTASGGSGNGTIFKANTNGAYTVLWRFNGTNGSYPGGSLAFGKDGTLYGITQFGGVNYNGDFTGNGTLFRITTNGLLTTLAFFNGTNGSNPKASLTLGNDGAFYGTTSLGGAFNLGTVFQITTNGILTTLLSFNGTNGSRPFGGLAQGADGVFYGTTAFSVSNGTNWGTVFGITTNAILTTLIYLNGTNGLHGVSNMTLGHDGNLYGPMFDVQGRVALDGSWGNIFRLVKQPLVSATPKNGGTVLSWNSVTNGVYRLDWKSSLTNPSWIPLATNTATGNTTSFTNSPFNATQRFYRVVLP